MAINFRSMDSEKQFEEMCRQLVCAEHPGAVPVEALPGDEGVDSYEGVIDQSVGHVWQFKHFPFGIGKRQQDQIRASLQSAIRRHQPRNWTLLTSTDLSLDNQRWLKKQCGDFPSTNITVISATQIRGMLTRHQGIRRQYFPLQDEKTDALMRLIAGDHRSGLPKAAILDAVRRDIEILNDDSPDLSYRFSFGEEGTIIGVAPRGPGAGEVALARVEFITPQDDTGARETVEAYVADIVAGRPAVIPGEYFRIVESVFDQFMGAGSHVSELRIIPVVPDIRLPTRLHVAAAGDEAQVAYVDLRLVRRGREEVEFSNEAQDGMPLRMRLTFTGKRPGSLEMWLATTAGMKPSAAVTYERVFVILGRPGAVVALESLTNGARLSSPIQLTKGDASEGRLRLFEDLMLIEKELDPGLRLPAKMTEADCTSAYAIGRALRGGGPGRLGRAEVVVVPQDPGQLRELAASEEVVTLITSDGVERFTLFGRCYEFAFEGLVQGSFRILEEGLADGGVRVEIKGPLQITYGRGHLVEEEKAVGSDPDS